MQAGNAPPQTGAHTYHNNTDTCCQEREPPPYPGFTRTFFQPGLRQSYSGSETSTDYSLSSCENLSTSTRQEPQGEETRAVTTSPLGVPVEGGADCERRYQDMLSRLGLAQQQGVEVKSTNSSTFYVTGNNMSSPTMTTCAGSQDNHMVSSSHGNHVICPDNQLKQMNGNNNNNNNNVKCFPSISQQQQQPAVGCSQPTLAQYQKTYQKMSSNPFPASPNASPTPSINPMKGASPLKGPSPTPLQQTGSPNVANQGTMGSVSRPGTPKSLSAPGTPNTPHHKSVPHMGCGVIGMMPSSQPVTDAGPAGLISCSPQSTSSLPRIAANPGLTDANSSVATVPAIQNGRSPTVQSRSQTPVTILPSGGGLQLAEGFQTPGGDQNSAQEVSLSLAQLMTALTMQSTVPSTTTSTTRQRPATAPTTRHLANIPPPPEYPGYFVARKDEARDGMSSLKADKPALVWSQPDLTRLAELKGTAQQQQQQQQQQQHEHMLPSIEQEHTHGLPSYEHGTHQGYNEQVYPQMEPQAATLHQALSTSSSTSSLTQLQTLQQQQQQQFQLPLALPHSKEHLQTINQNTTASPMSLVDPSLMDATMVALGTGLEMQGHGSTSPILRKLPELGHAAVATRATKMVERLSEENCFLRQELEGYANKVYRLQKLELEIQKVHENYETLEKHSQKQESLEKLIRYKLSAEIKKLRETNKELKDHLDKSLRQLQQQEGYTVVDADIKKELLGKDSLIAKLISQNRDLTSTKEHLEAEVGTQKSTINDQRAHMTILDNALSMARSNVLRYEEELQKRSNEDKKVSELQRALSQVQTAVEKRESIEQKLRQRLEEEVQFLRSQQGISKVTETDEGISSDSESPTSLQGLVRQMQEKEQRILALEAEVAKWKQKYLEETALRQFAVDVASVPKDARIAALESSSLETEKMIAEARTERLQHLDEVHVANRKCAELENRMKTLQAQLAEKEAMIKVLHHHTPRSHTSSISSLLGSPIHSPRPSFTSASSPLSSPQTSPLSSRDVSANPSGASSRQNSQLDTNYISGGCDGNGRTRDAEGKSAIHNKSNSTGTSTTVDSNNDSSKDSQLRELHQKLAAQAALFGGGFQSGSDQLKKYLWQV